MSAGDQEDPKNKPIARPAEAAQKVEAREEKDPAAREAGASTEQKDSIKTRNDKQVQTVLRTFDNVDDKDNNRPHGRLTSTQAEAMLVDSPTGTWLMRIDPSLKRMMLSIKDGASHVGHYDTDADAANAPGLRYRVDMHKKLPLREHDVRSDQKDHVEHEDEPE